MCRVAPSSPSIIEAYNTHCQRKKQHIIKKTANNTGSTVTRWNNYSLSCYKGIRNRSLSGRARAHARHLPDNLKQSGRPLRNARFPRVSAICKKRFTACDQTRQRHARWPPVLSGGRQAAHPGAAPHTPDGRGNRPRHSEKWQISTQTPKPAPCPQ